MKKAANSAARSSGVVAKERPGALKNHDHVHAANCGHKSYVHGNHIDYQCEDGHFHFAEYGKTYECTGPSAQILPFPKKK